VGVVLRKVVADDTAVTHYATSTQAWERWYDEYRFGALLIFPPASLRNRVNALRRTYDPRSQAICDAHISLTVPVKRPLCAADALELGGVVARLRAFETRWGPPYQYPGVPGVVLRVEPVSLLRRLVRQLERCPCFQPASPRRHPFSPHMTIAEFITLEQSTALVTALETEHLEGRFSVREIAYAVPDESFHFTERASWRLGPRPISGAAR
jgi:2'-5' RNA ligase